MNKSVKIIWLLSLAHALNDTLQSVVTASYPLIKEELSLSFSQIGFITFFYQISASILQPLLGGYFDKHPNPRALIAGVIASAIGIIIISQAQSYPLILLAVSLLGMGSSIFHPEASRLTRIAAKGREGYSQSLFQVGGNVGSAMGPLIVVFILSMRGREDFAYCLILSAISIYCVSRISHWAKKASPLHQAMQKASNIRNPFSKRKTIIIIAGLLLLMSSKFIYVESLRSYFNFYLIEKFDLSISQSQLVLFLFLISTAAGTITGGHFSDRIGHRRMIWISILGASPFALMLPHAGLQGCIVLSMIAGFILASAFPTMVVYAQKLLPRKIGLVSGLFFGFAFGIAGISSTLVGYLADIYGLERIFDYWAYTPLLGFIALFLPDAEKTKTNIEIQPSH